jgi:hypothetical protein
MALAAFTRLNQFQLQGSDFMKIYSVLLASVLFTMTAVAADVSGKWIAQSTSPSGSRSERVFQFKVAGDQLTGTVVNQSVVLATFEPTGKAKMTGTLKTQATNPQEIAEGKVSASDISFVLISTMGGNEVRNIYTGKISGDEITFTVEMKLPAGVEMPAARAGAPSGPPAPQKLVAKRAKASD